MKRFGHIMLIATLGLSQLSAKKVDQADATPSNELLTAIASLSSEEKVMLLDHLVGEHESLISRGAPLPAMLAKPYVTARSNEEATEKEHMEPAKRKFTTLTIAPNATSACFLPEVFSFNNQGKAFMYQSGAIGGLIGLIAAIGIDLYIMKGVQRSEFADKKRTANFASIAGGLGTGLSIAMLNYYRLKKSFVKNEDEDVIDFIQYKWKDLRSELVWPQHVVSILDYLQRKSNRGTFDLEEAKQCISALHEPGRVT